METRFFPTIGRDISLLGFGLMRLPLRGKSANEIDYDLGGQMVDRAIKAGVNYFDTAWPYHEGESENFAGAILSRYPRESYCLATKLPTWDIHSPADAERIFEEQLRRCKTEYIDFYLLHCLSKDNWPIVLKHGLYEMFQKKKEQGLIKHFGFSFHDTPPLLKTIVEQYDWDFAQIQLNYIDWVSLDAKRLYATLVNANVPIIVMEPVRGGTIASLTTEGEDILRKTESDASIASWAIRYAASFPGILTVLSGMSTMDQVEDNLKTLSGFRPLTEDDKIMLDKVAHLFRMSNPIPCTGCRYCMDCPAGVNIPQVITVYNYYKLKGARHLFDIYYAAHLDDSEKAEKCTACGQCLERCPQSIDIPTRMEEIAAFAAEKPKG